MPLFDKSAKDKPVPNATPTQTIPANMPEPQQLPPPPPKVDIKDETLSFHRVDIANNGAVVYSEGAYLCGFFFSNTQGTARYVHFYEKRSLPTTGKDTPRLTVAVPANGIASLSYVRVPFHEGIAVSVSTGAGDTDNGTAAAGDVVVDVFYAPRVRGQGGWQ